jgi:hypothetical protein
MSNSKLTESKPRIGLNTRNIDNKIFVHDSFTAYWVMNELEPVEEKMKEVSNGDIQTQIS